MRALALRTLSYVHVKDFVESAVRPVKSALNDPDPYVRKTACYAVAKLYDHDKGLVERTDLINGLNTMLRDENQTVVSSALAALVDIWERSESIRLTIDYSSASKIVQILPDCSEYADFRQSALSLLTFARWGQTYILEALMNFIPQDSQEASLLAERIAPRLSHSNSAVVLGCIRVILYLTNYIADEQTVNSLASKLSPPIVTLLSKGHEIQYLALRNVLLILQQHPEILRHEIRVFFCKYNDPIYVKVTKLELIFTLANEKNIHEVLVELKEYATEIDLHFVRKAVRAIGKLAIKIESASRECIKVLLELVATKVSYIVQEAVVVIRNIFRRYPNQYESIIATLCQHLDSLDEAEAKAAMIWIIGQYADRIENSDALLEDFLYTFTEEPHEVQLALLTATVKLFILRPTKGQSLVPKVLQWATQDTDNPDLRDRGYMYWRLLSTDPEAARDIVMGDKPPIVAEKERLDPVTLQEMTMCIGSLATIYLKPIRTVFRTARPRVIQDSPALQRDRLPTERDWTAPATSLGDTLRSPTSAPMQDLRSPTGPDPLSAITANSRTQDTGSAIDAADVYFGSLHGSGGLTQQTANMHLAPVVGRDMDGSAFAELPVSASSNDGLTSGAAGQGFVVNQHSAIMSREGDLLDL